jgi:hypothetical protein
MNPMYLNWIALWAGALVPTFIVSRLTLLLIKRSQRHKFLRLAFAHGLALAIGVLLVGFGTGTGDFSARITNMLGAGLITGLYYNAIPQGFWLSAEYVWRDWRRGRNAE